MLHVESNKAPRFLGNERVPDIYAYMLVLTGVAMSGDHNQFCFVII